MVFLKVSMVHSLNKTCGPGEADLLCASFWNSDKVRHTSCPEEAWLTVMAADDISNPNKLLINIGVNKGYNFAIWMNIFAKWTGVNPGVWQQGLLAVEPYFTTNPTTMCGSCGCCQDCKTEINTDELNNSPFAHNEQNHGIVMVGVDLNGKNVKMLNEVVARLASASE